MSWRQDKRCMNMQCLLQHADVKFFDLLTRPYASCTCHISFVRHDGHKTARPGVYLSCNTVQSTTEAPTCRHHRRLLTPDYIAWHDRMLTLPTYGFVRSVTKLWSVELGNACIDTYIHAVNRCEARSLCNLTSNRY